MNKIEFFRAAKAPFKTRYGNDIGGEWVEPVERPLLRQLSPINGQVLCEIARSDAADVERALDAAHAAKDAWGRTSAAERAVILTPSRSAWKTTSPCWPRRDLGQRQADPRTDGRRPAARHRPFPLLRRRIRAQEGPISEIDQDTVAYHFHEPLGVVGQIIPWNFPLLMALLEARARRSPPAIAWCSSPPSRPRPHPRWPSWSATCCRRASSTSSTASASRPAAARLSTAHRQDRLYGETTTGRLIMQYAETT